MARETQESTSQGGVGYYILQSKDTFTELLTA